MTAARQGGQTTCHAEPAAPVPRFRPHHFLCALGFQGKGYTPEFSANMATIVDRLRGTNGSAVEIEVVGAADDICAPCPSRRGTGCIRQTRIDRLDTAHGAALGLRPGNRLRWGAALERIRDRVKPGDLANLCRGCQWLELGLCEDALARLHARQD